MDLGTHGDTIKCAWKSNKQMSMNEKSVKNCGDKFSVGFNTINEEK
jgi:hypothetical protein